MIGMSQKVLFEDSAARVFSAEIMLPDQFFERANAGSAHYAEKRLMLAVLQEAVGTFQRHVDTESGPGVRIFREVEKWFRSSDSSWPFSFENICNALEINPLYLRRALKVWRESLRDLPENTRGYRTRRATVPHSVSRRASRREVVR
jgi:hypothetical protein